MTQNQVAAGPVHPYPDVLSGQLSVRTSRRSVSRSRGPTVVVGPLRWYSSLPRVVKRLGVREPTVNGVEVPRHTLNFPRTYTPTLSTILTHLPSSTDLHTFPELESTSVRTSRNPLSKGRRSEPKEVGRQYSVSFLFLPRVFVLENLVFTLFSLLASLLRIFFPES